MPSTTTVFSAYSSLTASSMLVRAIVNEVKSILNLFIPIPLQRKIISKLGCLYGHQTTELILNIHEHGGGTRNQMYEASEVYLRTMVASPSLARLAVSKCQREKSLAVTAEKDQDVVEIFEGVQVKWRLICINNDSASQRREKQNFYELSFPKLCKEIVLSSYLPYVLKRSKEIKEENMGLKLHALGLHRGLGGVWGSTNLNHPSTFDTLAMDINLKKEVLEDLDRFVKRKEFYKRVGKPWKRGYLLYGPPGTGKSSLIAAMANYLHFNIYDMELTSIYSNSDLRKLLVSTRNRSILVIEDIDCSVEFKDRTSTEGASNRNQFTLSGLLNFIDGLWSSCGDERIIIFTTNYKDRLDPALLRPGRMDMHIHMSYCTPCGFKLLASNYLQIQNHPLFEQIQLLIKNVNVTPAEVAEELMKSDDSKTSLEGLLNFLQSKKTHPNESNAEEGERKPTNPKQAEEQKAGKGNKRPKKAKKAKVIDYDD
ncbi:Aaa-atpase [Thalictrum thalictroides]|uniref:Aaa-atpase n=1 Tax=Thalictrum thalictroides TaxID=46969 RepID=A0A7J6X544_THATH|nr:Aaa-atpase [Thalictrum thalictroides]